MSSLARTQTLSPSALRPSSVLGRYPENLRRAPARVERLWRSLVGSRPLGEAPRRGRSRRFVADVARQAALLGTPDAARMRAAADDIRHRLASGNLDETLLARVFALVQAAAWQTLGLRHHDVQLIGGWVMARGALAEMQTGEGKTLTATLPACAAALAGVPVHLVTVNDYLAGRDATNMRPLYEALGISVGDIHEGLGHTARRQAYARDVTYCTAKQLAFDYLRDRIVLAGERDPLRLSLEKLRAKNARSERLMLRGLCFAIVDEADSVLIDEARTPLLVAGPGDEQRQANEYLEAIELARALADAQHFRIDASNGSIALTPEGCERLEQLAEPLSGMWHGPRAREQMVRQALAALYLFRRDRHYLVRDGKVQIVDEHTGRTMADRSWQSGLHQMIEAKEQCELSTPPRTLARISFQRFFGRYLRLAGMTGTAREVAGELRGVYGLNVVEVPTHAPVRRRALGGQMFATAARKRQAVLDSVRRQRAAGRPVLVGTRSVEESERLSDLLTRSGVPHQVLNARQDDAEAQIVARAGERGRVTIATNMAGRGTDIALGPGTANAGGLHVIVTGRNEAGRIDRQMIGRCARQGEPGSYEYCLSLEDMLLQQFGALPLGRLAKRLSRDGRVAGWLGSLLQGLAQRRAERRHRSARRLLLDQDQRVEDSLAFSGHGE